MDSWHPIALSPYDQAQILRNEAALRRALTIATEALEAVAYTTVTPSVNTESWLRGTARKAFIAIRKEVPDA